MEKVEKYAKENGIDLLSPIYQSYTMVKKNCTDFPLMKMFFSQNQRGQKRGKSVTIICKDDKISHMDSYDILEKPVNRTFSSQQKIMYNKMSITKK